MIRLANHLCSVSQILVSEKILMQRTPSLDLSSIRYCPNTTEHPFDTTFAPAQANSDWVKLAQTPEAIAEEEYALLLCPHGEQSWVAWLPSQGEVVLHQDQLCRLI